jgi:hypothetical protein
VKHYQNVLVDQVNLFNKDGEPFSVALFPDLKSEFSYTAKLSNTLWLAKASAICDARERDDTVMNETAAAAGTAWPVR